MAKNIQNGRLKHTLKQIQLRSQLAFGRTLTQGDIAKIAGTTVRSLGDWMRGDTTPPGMSAILELLSHLPDDDTLAILHDWKSSSSNQPERSKKQSLSQASPDKKNQRKLSPNKEA